MEPELDHQKQARGTEVPSSASLADSVTSHVAPACCCNLQFQLIDLQGQPGHSLGTAVSHLITNLTIGKPTVSIALYSNIGSPRLNILSGMQGTPVRGMRN